MKQASQVSASPRQNDAQSSMMSSMQKNMVFISPIMTGFISFTVPAGLGLYWIIGNIIQILQQMFLNRFVIKKKKTNNLKVNYSN